ncbi:MAG: YybH family protein [Parasphingopyxis sp.]|uniref:YybH family protein n=1 Tax=Parasphingopyxis sp. TaxID=1920299 RepID=UPI003F9EEE4D
MARLETLGHAIHNKDAAAAIACHADDFVSFDLAPPLARRNAEALEPAEFEEWFATWDGPIETEPHDTEIFVSADMACAHGLLHMTGTKVGGEKIDLWYRTKTCLRREGEDWLITHNHSSVPFAMDGSERALLDLKPAA